MEVGMGRAGADRLACCKVLMEHCTHCEDGGTALLSQEELKVLRSHRRQAEVCTHFLQDYRAGDQNCCNRYFQNVHSCCSWYHKMVHSFLEADYNCLEESHRYLGEDCSCPEAGHSGPGEDRSHH